MLKRKAKKKCFKLIRAALFNTSSAKRAAMTKNKMKFRKAAERKQEQNAKQVIKIKQIYGQALCEVLATKTTPMEPLELKLG